MVAAELRASLAMLFVLALALRTPEIGVLVGVRAGTGLNFAGLLEGLFEVLFAGRVIELEERGLEPVDRSAE
jgi:hypothetical protein